MVGKLFLVVSVFPLRVVNAEGTSWGPSVDSDVSLDTLNRKENEQVVSAVA